MTGFTELIGQSVWDVHGIWVGHIVDIRAVKDRTGLQQTHRIYGLVVSARRAPVMLGMTHGRESWLSILLGRIVYAGCHFVPWDTVSEYGEGEVHIKAARKELSRV